MAAIDNLMKRMGFVRLSRYGLVLTPEGRIMTLRPEVLDDGMGGKIVGWRDRDLAAAELASWQSPASARAVASPVAAPPTAVRVSPPVAARTISPLTPPPFRPVAVAVPLPSPTAPVARPAPIVVKPAISMAPVAEPEEDEWEWEIALARARAVAEEVQAAAPPTRASRRSRQDTVPPPAKFVQAKTTIGVAPPKLPSSQTLPMATVAPDPITTGEWPKTEPLGNIDYEDRTSPINEVARVIRLAKVMTPPAVIPAKPTPAPERTFARAPSPATIIPVPRLPRAAGPIEPVVARTRFPKATPPVANQKPLQISPPPPIRPAEDDKTSPGMMAISSAEPSRPYLAALPRIPSILDKRAR
jgi:hypothetical protein